MLVLGNTYTTFGAVVLAAWLWTRHRRSKRVSLPPGPEGLPILGNIRELASSRHIWERATEWAKIYGPVVCLHVFGLSLVFLNTAEAAFDLLEKRGSIYSDRPHMTMSGELCGCERMVAFTRYGDASRRQRRLLQKALSGAAVKAYHPLIEANTRDFLQRIVRDPDDYARHIRWYAGGLTLNVVYGHRVSTTFEDPYLAQAESCVDLLSNRIASPDAVWIVDVFPFLKHLPAWLPGMHFKRQAQTWKRVMQDWVDKPYDAMKAKLGSGVAPPSFCSTLLASGLDLSEKDEDDIRWTANSIYAASIDTTVTLALHFVRLMAIHPRILRKVQKELDSVLRSTDPVTRERTVRLPMFADRPRLPYLEHVLSETLRYAAPVPAGLPHRLQADDIYAVSENGDQAKEYLIPKGSFVFANIWAILRDERVYPNPDEFFPERYEVSNVDPQDPNVADDEENLERERRRRDPRNYVFGFGRRRCPGTHLVESSAWLLIATMCAALDIEPARDTDGKEMPPELVVENGVFRTPNVFPVSIKLRAAAPNF